MMQILSRKGVVKESDMSQNPHCVHPWGCLRFETADDTQKVVPSGGWGSFLLLNDAISLPSHESQTIITNVMKNVLSNLYKHTLDAVIPDPRCQDWELGRINFAVRRVDKWEVDARVETNFRGNVRV
jgi:hypothetical protein